MPTVSGFSVIVADRVRETTSTTGTGTYSLNGASTGFRTFVAGIGSGNRCLYSAALGSSWEVGIGTVTSGAPATLSRDQITASSNSNNAVNWGAGTKDIFADASAALLTQIFPAPTHWTSETISTLNSTSHDFTAVPSGCQQIWLVMRAVSMNTGNGFALRLGTSGGFIASGYVGAVEPSVVFTTTFQLLSTSSATDQYIGKWSLTRRGATDDWYIHGSATNQSTGGFASMVGYVPLGGTLTQLRVLGLSGASFDNGTATAEYHV